MKNKSILALTIAVVAAGSLLAAGNSYAYRGNPAVEGPYHTEERETAMDKAFDNYDYNAWKNLMVGRGRVTQIINQGNFAKFAKAHKLAEEGKFTEANQIRSELGLGLQNGEHQSMGMKGRYSK